MTEARVGSCSDAVRHARISPFNAPPPRHGYYNRVLALWVPCGVARAVVAARPAECAVDALCAQPCHECTSLADATRRRSSLTSGYCAAAVVVAEGWSAAWHAHSARATGCVYYFGCVVLPTRWRPPRLYIPHPLPTHPHAHRAGPVQ